MKFINHCECCRSWVPIFKACMLNTSRKSKQIGKNNKFNRTIAGTIPLKEKHIHWSIMEVTFLFKANEMHIFYSNTFAELCLKGIHKFLQNKLWATSGYEVISTMCALFFISSQWISLNVYSARSCNKGPHSARTEIIDGKIVEWKKTIYSSRNRNAK